MSLEKLEKEIAIQRAWDEIDQKDFIKTCLRYQGNFKRVKTKDVENVFQAYKEKALHDESIQYYVRIYLEMRYDKYQ